MTGTPAVVLRPNGAELSREGNAIALLAIPWFFGWAIGGSAVLRALDVPGPAGQSLAWLTAVVAIAPVVMWIGSPVVAKLPGLRWLLEPVQPRATIDAESIRLDLPTGTTTLAWSDVASLRLIKTSRGRFGELLSPDGSVLATVPGSLVYPKPGWRTLPTLAKVVVETRPDRYVLTAARWSHPDEFDLKDRALATLDVAAVERHRRLVVRAVLAGLIVIGLVGTILLAARAN